MADPQNPWAVVKSEPIPSADPWAVVKNEPTSQAKPSVTDLALRTATGDPSGTLEDVLIGGAKGTANTLIGMGELIHKIPGVSEAIDAFYGKPGLSKAAFPAARDAVKPTNTTQQVGQTAEQVGEFFLPTGATGKIGTLAEIAKNAYLTGAQGGGSGDVAMSAGLSAIPGSQKLAKAASGALESSAERSMVQALGPTKAGMKAEAQQLAPQMLARGIGGSRPAMLEHASEQVGQIGQALGAAYSEAAKRGDTILGAPVLDALDKAARSLQVEDAKGVMRAIPGTQDAIGRLQDLHTFTASMGDTIPLDKAAVIRRTLDSIVDKAGLFGNKATASATDASRAWSTREAANAFRGLINSRDATISDLNKEFSFWKGLQDVLTETEARTKPHGIGLTASLAGSGGATAGAMLSGTVGGGAVGAAAAAGLTKMMQSPAFRSKVSAPLKNMFADALASGNAARIAAITKTIFAATPAQVDK